MRFLPRSGSGRLVFALLAGLVVSVAIIALRGAGSLQPAELMVYDYMLGRERRDSIPDGRIVLIKITENDLKRQGHWPMTDGELAGLLSFVAACRPSAIGLDVYRDVPVPPGERALRAVFSGNRNIIGVRKIGEDAGSTVSGPYAVSGPDRIGFNDLVVDPDGIIRRGLLFLDDGKTVYSSFSLLLAAHYLQTKGIGPEAGEKNREHLKLGRTTFVPLSKTAGGYSDIDTRGYQYLLDFGKPAVRVFTLTDISRGEVNPDALADRVVIIGAAAESLKDVFHTPLSKAEPSAEFSYGLELHGYMAGQLIRSALGESRPVAYAGDAYEWGWIIIIGLAGALAALSPRPLWRFLLVFSSILAFTLLAAYFTFLKGWWIPLVPPLFSCLISSGLVVAYISSIEKAEKHVLMQLFGKHVSPEVARVIWQERDKFMADGRPRPQKLTATILFTDLMDFTSISERLDPETLLEWLNEYMDAMAHVITEHGGTINKYIGDSIMAVFGVPLQRETEPQIDVDVINAVGCALDLGKEIESLNTGWRTRGLPEGYMRMGIFTGPVVAGCLGSSQRMEYTVVGDTVNIASRLEGFGKEDGLGLSDERPWRILIGEPTLQHLGRRFETAPVGEVKLKGKGEKVTVHLVTAANTGHPLNCGHDATTQGLTPPWEGL
jgi:adenylate cyclase